MLTNIFILKKSSAPCAIGIFSFSFNKLSNLLLAGKEQAVKLSLPRASSLNENVDHSALLKLGGTVLERVNRFDSKSDGDGRGPSTGFSKLQETRRIFEQRTLQVRKLFVLLTCVLCVYLLDFNFLKLA